MLRFRRILLITLSCFLFILLYKPLNVTAQQPETFRAIVIVERAYLRVEPYNQATVQEILKTGAKLIVTPSVTHNGWYSGYLEETPSVYGYIFGNSIRRSNSPVTDKNVSTKKKVKIVPRDITLDDTLTQSPDVYKPETKNRVNNSKAINLSNYCKPPLYCPDIDDVQVALFDNIDKFQKGKFEKTVDWEKRKPTILREIILKESHTVADKMTFLSDSIVNSLSYDGATYDADKELWTFETDFRDIPSGTCIPILSKHAGQILCLLSSKKLDEKSKVFVSMPPSIAAVNDKNLQLAFVGKIVEPYVWTNKLAQIDEDILSGIYFELEEIICLNAKTGQRWKVDTLTKINNSNTTINNTKEEVYSSENDALAQFKRILVAEPMNAEAHSGIGKIYSSRAEYDEAISSLKTALIWNNRLIEAHTELSKVYFIKGDCKQAQSYSESALEIDSKNAAALALKSLIGKCPATSTNTKNSDNTSLISTPKQSDNLYSSQEDKKQYPFVGNWNMKFVEQNQPKSLVLTVSQKGAKYEGFLSDSNNQSTKRFAVKFDGTNFIFETSGKNNFSQKVVLKVLGSFDGNSIKGSMIFNTLGTITNSEFNGTFLN